MYVAWHAPLDAIEIMFIKLPNIVFTIGYAILFVGVFVQYFDHKFVRIGAL